MPVEVKRTVRLTSLLEIRVVLKLLTFPKDIHVRSLLFGAAKNYVISYVSYTLCLNHSVSS